jgi:hypothetical protein
MPHKRHAALVVAFTTVACAIGWLIADVQLNYAGHLTGLFYTGSKAQMPPAPVGDNAFRVRDERGYDGEFYYLIAHDPLNRRGFLAYVDSPRYRWRRIGLPGLAWLLALGNDDYIDRMYVALQLGFLFGGAFWLARYAAMLGWHPAWGLAFLAIPGVSISLDRMTVDLPIAALTVLMLLYAPRRPVYAALITAPLIRETGLILILVWCVFRILGRNFRDAVLGAACAIPTLAWYFYVALRTTPDQTPFLASYPFGGLVTWTLHALSGPAAVYGPRASAAFELLALAGIWLAFVLAVGIAVRRKRDLPSLLAVMFALFASLIGYQDIWASAYGLGRTLTPLLIALAVIGLRDRSAIFALPLLSFLPRVALQFAAEIRVGLHSAGLL